MELRVKKFKKDIPLPRYEKMAAGFDFYCIKNALIRPGEMKALPTNIALEIPEGYALLVLPRSSTAIRFGLMMPHSMGLIDPFYRADSDEIMLLFYNFSNTPARVRKGDRLAQGVLIKYEKAKFKEIRRRTRKAGRKLRIKPRKKFRKLE